MSIGEMPSRTARGAEEQRWREERAMEDLLQFRGPLPTPLCHHARRRRALLRA